MEKLKLYSQLNKITKWLTDNDYKINKHLLGEYADDDERWTTYLQERQDKLQAYNDIELRIKEITDAEIAYAIENKERIKQERLDALKKPEVVEDLVEETLEEDVNFTYEEIEAAKLEEDEEVEEDKTVEDTETTDTEL